MNACLPGPGWTPDPIRLSWGLRQHHEEEIEWPIPATSTASRLATRARTPCSLYFRRWSSTASYPLTWLERSWTTRWRAFRRSGRKLPDDRLKCSSKGYPARFSLPLLLAREDLEPSCFGASFRERSPLVEPTGRDKGGKPHLVARNRHRRIPSANARWPAQRATSARFTASARASQRMHRSAAGQRARLQIMPAPRCIDRQRLRNLCQAQEHLP